MALTIGSHVGPYEVIAPLGVGGMGEVCRARDSRLNRDVALKVLPDAFARDPERLARFKREAQVLAALNHPHIAAIYGIEDADGLQALVLELVEGRTLAERLSGAGRVPRPSAGSGRPKRVEGPSGPAGGAGLPIDETLPIARQVADALEAAHELGIVHRDPKPANIKITPDGVVKVLDFGLAKLGPAEAGHYVSEDRHVSEDRRPAPEGRSVRLQPDLSQAPTMTSPAMTTGVGMLLGTAAYMSPEQAKGREADKRSDVWGFGCVLCEMLTGRRAFGGDDVSDTLAAVLRAEPDWAALPKDTPTAIARLLRWCLQKNRKQRAPDIAIARFEIDSVLHPSHDGTPAEKPRSRPPWQTLAATAALVIVACAVTGFAVWSWLRPEPAPLTRFDIVPSAVAPFTIGPPGVNLAISPDGRQIVYHVRRGVGALELQRFDRLDSQPIPDTEGARHPAFSPDGRSLVFVKEGRMVKGSRSRGFRRCSPRARRDSRQTDAGSRTSRIKRATPRCGSGRFRVQARPCACRQTADAILCGPETEKNCSIRRATSS